MKLFDPPPANWAQNVLQCPYCGDTYLHLGEVSVRQNGQNIVVRHEDRAPKLSHSMEPEPYRGARIKIRFLGECGHSFNLVLQFHKGSTAYEVERLPDVDYSNGSNWDELWRD